MVRTGLVGLKAVCSCYLMLWYKGCHNKLTILMPSGPSLKMSDKE